MPALPLVLELSLVPEERTTPTDAADVLQSLDDVFRAVRMAKANADADENDAIRSGAWVEIFTRGQQVGHGSSPLTVRRFNYGSPFDVVTHIPWEAFAGVSGLALFLTQVERLWNMPRRIKLESARLDAETYKAKADQWHLRLEAVSAENAYWRYRKSVSGRHLQGLADSPAFSGQDGIVRDALPEEVNSRDEVDAPDGSSAA